MIDHIRIATRQSQLARWQANFVKSQLQAAHPGLKVDIVGIKTQGDKDKQSPLYAIGGKGVFVKKLEVALQEGCADIAVHSMKDVPAVLPGDLMISAICERADPRDAFISKHYRYFTDMPDGASIGSSSLRRCLQLKRYKPNLNYVDLRGNVDTRLRKLNAGEYDGIVLAVAGLQRLGLAQHITQAISPDVCIPAAGQGAIGIECRIQDDAVHTMLAAINDRDTFVCVTCERQISTSLGANCTLPIAAFAELDGDNLSLSTYFADIHGEKVIRVSKTGQQKDYLGIAAEVVAEMQKSGAYELMNL